MTRSSADKAEDLPASRHRLTVRHIYLLVPIAVVAWRAVTPLSDNSFLWHVRAGTLQLEAGEVLRTDPFSFTAFGTPWRTQSWLVELGYGWLENLTGSVQWSPTLMFVIMGATLAFVGLATYRVVGDPTRTALAMVTVAWVGMLFVVPRPVIFSFLLLSVFVVVLQHVERLAWVLVPLAWLWASIHGLFIVGLALVALEALRRRSLRLLAVGVLAGAATLLTAHGFGILRILLDFAENRDALGLLSEWKRPAFLSRWLAPAVLVGAAVVWALIFGKLDRRAWFVAAPFLILGALQLRSVYPSLIVLAPLAASALVPTRPVRVRPPGSPVINAGIASAIALMAVIGLARPIDRDTGVLPPEGAVLALGTERVFHGPGAGGLLIWSEYPDRLVFMDDRAELFGVEFYRDFLEARAGSTGVSLLDRYGLDEALVITSWPIADSLSEAGWRERYRDEDWAVYQRP